jgi:Protein of unknown function (DUF2793)
MPNTTKLQLPQLAAAQAQKHVTHNEALLILDNLVQMSIKGLLTNTPPGSPAESDTYVTGAAPTGVWALQPNKVATFQNATWKFYTPKKGWLAYNEADAKLYVVNVSLVWVDVSAAFTAFTLMGIGGATADNTNRLSVNSPSVLFNNAGTSINTTLNKNATANDASFTFQVGFSARALLGLLGNDEFTFKVTPDGSTYFTSMRTHRLLHGRVSEKAAERRTYQQWQPRVGAAAIDQEGLAATITGTLNTVTPAASNLFTQSPRVKVTSGATAGSSSSANGAGLFLWRGNAADQGGFYIRMVGGIETFQATSRAFMGLYSSAAVIGNVNPSTLLNIFGIGFDSGDTTMSLINNDATAGAVKTSLGAGFPTAGGQDLYELILSAEPNGTEVRYRVERLNGGNVAEGVVTARLPVNTQFMTPHFWYNNGTTAAAVEWAIHGMYCENVSMLGSRGLLI